MNSFTNSFFSDTILYIPCCSNKTIYGLKYGCSKRAAKEEASYKFEPVYGASSNCRKYCFEHTSEYFRPVMDHFLLGTLHCGYIYALKHN